MTPLSPTPSRSNFLMSGGAKNWTGPKKKNSTVGLNPASCRPRSPLLVFQSMRSSVHAFGTCGRSWCATRGGQEHIWGLQHASKFDPRDFIFCWEQSIGWFRVNGASGHSIADLFARKLAYSDQESTENRLQGALSPSEKAQLPFQTR